MWKVPLFDISFDSKELEAVQRVIESGWLTMGETTLEFERQFAGFLGVKHAIAVSSGSAALHVANLALDIGPEDEVICPSLSFVAAANSIVYTGARPVFADIEGLDYLSISPQDIESRITPRTRAIQVVHYGGYPCDMDGILDVAKTHSLPVIEDCAHAPGAEYKGKKCGTIGDIGCFSFFSNKNMTTGEGGMVATNDDGLADRIRLMRTHGMTTQTLERHRGQASSYDVIELGYNYRLDEIRSALGLVQLEKLEGNNRKRKQIREWYVEGLESIRGIGVPYIDPRGVPVHHVFPLILDRGIDRAEFMNAMRDSGVQTSIHYPPIHLFEFYRRTFGLEQGHLTVTEEAARREVTLPLYPSMSNTDVEYVCGAVSESLRRGEKR